VLEQLGSLCPDWAKSHPATLSPESNLIWWIGSDIAATKIENLLYTGSRVEHQAKHCVVTLTGARGAINVIK
jgi:hypothetical protein